MEFVAAVAAGLNPYVGTFLLAALAALTHHVPRGDLWAVIPGWVPGAVAIVFGLAMPVDFVLGKIVRFAALARRVGQFVAPLSGALAAASVTRSDLPLPLVAAAGAVISWAVSAMLTSAAARASRSPAWVGLGHVPVFISAATAAAVMVPLGLAKLALGLGLAATAVGMLLGSTLMSLRAAAVAQTAFPAAAAPTIRAARVVSARRRPAVRRTPAR